MKTQNPIQMNPIAPMTMNAISQPYLAAMTGTVMGAIRAPTCAPELNMLVENARSFLGKNSAVVLMAAGKLPASPRASTNRAKMKRVTLTEVTSPMSSTVPIILRASSKPTNHFPAVIPEVAIPQKA